MAHRGGKVKYGVGRPSAASKKRSVTAHKKKKKKKVHKSKHA